LTTIKLNGKKMDMHHILGMIIAIVAIIGGFAIAIYLLQKAFQQEFMQKTMDLENIGKERLLLIEKGMDPSLANKKRRPGGDPLLWGLLLAGLGFGVFLGYMLARANNMGGGGIVIHALGLFFGGIGLIIYYIIQRIQQKNDAKKAK
jgi:preprotein translocase subunit YajC